MIDAIVVSPAADISHLEGRHVIQHPLEAGDIKYRHDRHLLHIALEQAVQSLG